MLEVRGMNAWLKKTEAMKKKVKDKATAHVRKQVLKTFRVVLAESPQYSGDFVSNWEIVTNVNGATGYTEYRYKDKLEKAALRLGAGSEEYLAMIRSAGHPEAIAYAYQNGLEVVEVTRGGIKWNTKISLRNSAPIADSIATGSLYPSPYRPVHAHLEGQAFITYIKQRRGMGWIG